MTDGARGMVKVSWYCCCMAVLSPRVDLHTSMYTKLQWHMTWYYICYKDVTICMFWHEKGSRQSL